MRYPRRFGGRDGLICGLMVVGLLVILQGLGTSVSGSYNDTRTKIALATRT